MNSKKMIAKGQNSFARGNSCTVKATPLNERDASLYFIAGLLSKNNKDSNKHIEMGKRIMKVQIQMRTRMDRKDEERI